MDFCKPDVIQGLSLNFNLFLEIFFRGADFKFQAKTQTFQEKFCIIRQ